MEMKTLVECFSQQKAELKAKLEKVNSGKQIARIIDDYLKELGQMDGEYVAGLTINQAKLANEMLRAVRAGFNSINTSPDLSSYSQTSSPSESAESDGARFSSVVPGSLSGIAGSLAGRVIGNTPIALALGLGIGAFIGIGAQIMGSSSSLQEAPSVPATDISPAFDIDGLLKQLEEAFQTIDQSIEAQAAPVEEEKPSQPSLDEFKDILAFFQDLLSELNVGQDEFDTSVRRRISQVRGILRKYGVEVKEPEASYSDEDQIYALFDPEPSLDPDADPHALIRPALIKEDQVLLRGAVVAADDAGVTEV